MGAAEAAMLDEAMTYTVPAVDEEEEEEILLLAVDLLEEPPGQLLVVLQSLMEMISTMEYDSTPSASAIACLSA